MKKIYVIIMSIVLAPHMLRGDGHGYIEKIENNYPLGTVYMLNTDPTPGQFYIANSVGNETAYNGSTIITLKPQKNISHFNDYVIPFASFGGTLYLWLKDAQGNIINAATIQEIDSYITFAADNQLHTPNYLYTKDSMIDNVFTTQCSRKQDVDPLICKWWRSNTNQQFIITVGSDGTFILTRYSETPVTIRCALGDISCAFKSVGSFLENTGNTIGNAFKSLGGDFVKGFNKLNSCMDIASLGTQLTAKMAAKETFLSGKLTDAILQAAQESAVQPLIGARKAAEQMLKEANAFLEKVANPVVSGTLDAAKTTAAGTLQAGETVATGVLTGADKAVQGILELFDIQQIRYEGSLQELASGTLGIITCKAIIAKQKIDFDFSLNIKNPNAVIDGIKTLANKIADKFMNIAQKSIQGLKLTQAYNILNHDDLIALTFWHHTKQTIV